jgi:hypothetical protein
MCGRVRLPEDYSELKIDLKLHEIVPHTYEPELIEAVALPV